MTRNPIDPKSLLALTADAGSSAPRRRPRARHTLAWLLVSLMLVVGCAKRPVLYPNATLEEVGVAASQNDIDECIALAEAADLDSNEALEAGKRTAGGAAVGTATGVVSGAITGRPGTGAAIGAATGATAGFFSWLFGASDPDPIFVNYVNRCLSERGYETIGWK